MMKNVLAAAVAAASLITLTGVDFYSVPSPLPSGAPGTIVWSRPFTGGSALTNAARNTLVLYHTVSASGRDVAVSGVVSIPKGTPPAGGWPVISWAHGTTGNAPQCAPSNFTRENVEQRFLNGWVARGFVVAQTDYEGEGTAGVHPYFSGVSSAHDTIDIVRAARHLDPDISNRWIVMGHSEGGTAALFVASLANSWAPELELAGAVAYAPGSDIPDFFGQMTLNRQPTPMLVLLAMMVQGIASIDPRVDLNNVLTPKGLALLPSLQTACAGTLMDSPQWNTIAPADFFQASARSSALMQDFIANEPSQQHLHQPVLIEQGTADQMVPYQDSDILRSAFCNNGQRVQLDGVQGASHDTVMAMSFDRVAAWISDRFASKPFTGNCPSS